MDCGVAFCHHGCPLGNLIPEWNDLVGRDEWHAAIERLHATNNFPEFTGRLCPAPCEPACVLAINDDPVTIEQIEKSIIERAFEEGWVRAEPPSHRTGKRVAVAGSGPAGLAAAQQLNRAGHRVTVYEKADRIGGLLRYGIPDFKMEKRVLDRRLDLLEAEGIIFETGYAIGTDISTDRIREDFDAVVVADGNITAAGKKVVIIGGGDTGADCYGNVIREGCASVQQLYIYPQPPPDRPHGNPWPDWPLILRTYPAHEEGGARDFGIMVTGFSGENGAVGKLHARRVEPRYENGGRRFEPISAEEITIDAELVLIAIGFAGPSTGLVDDLGLPRDRRTNVVVDADFATTVPGVFAAGDAVRGASLIVWAIADGRIAARSCDRYLMGSSRLP
jgi:glutamate synthase (NADPH/NADH) small chain